MNLIEFNFMVLLRYYKMDKHTNHEILKMFVIE